MKTASLITALMILGTTGVAIAQSTDNPSALTAAQRGYAPLPAERAAAPGPASVVTEQKVVIVTPQPKTREEVKEELQQARESNQLLYGEMYPVADVLSRPYGLLGPAGQTSVGSQAPAGSQATGQ